MSKKNKIIEEVLTSEEVLVITTHSQADTTKKLTPSHWAREEGLDPALFVYYDKEGSVAVERYRAIKNQGGM